MMSLKGIIYVSLDAERPLSFSFLEMSLQNILNQLRRVSVLFAKMFSAFIGERLQLYGDGDTVFFQWVRSSEELELNRALPVVRIAVRTLHSKK